MPASIKHLSNLLKKKKTSGMSLYAKWAADRLFYEVKLLKIDPVTKKMCVRFEDSTEYWAERSELHLQLGSSDLLNDDDIICCICDKGDSVSPNQIVLCDVCQQGYHQTCYPKQIDSSKIDSSQEWICETCSYFAVQSQPGSVNMFASTPIAKKEPTKTKKPAQKPLLKPQKEENHGSSPIKKQKDKTKVMLKVKKSKVEPQKTRIKLPKKPIESGTSSDAAPDNAAASSDSSESEAENSVEKVEGKEGQTIEKMAPEIYTEVNKLLGEKDTNNVTTNDFVGFIDPNEVVIEHVPEPEPPSQVNKAPVVKPKKVRATKVPRKINGPTPPPA